jgi:hypothetical protein
MKVLITGLAVLAALQLSIPARAGDGCVGGHDHGTGSDKNSSKAGADKPGKDKPEPNRAFQEMWNDSVRDAINGPGFGIKGADGKVVSPVGREKPGFEFHGLGGAGGDRGSAPDPRERNPQPQGQPRQPWVCDSPMQGFPVAPHTSIVFAPQGVDPTRAPHQQDLDSWGTQWWSGGQFVHEEPRDYRSCTPSPLSEHQVRQNMSHNQGPYNLATNNCSHCAHRATSTTTTRTTTHHCTASGASPPLEDLPPGSATSAP